ncbi:MAG: hypothetical protein K6B74_00035 [Ruminococcus sp.]|nr:hypothetical protein [Ruminococcus sp.]
MDKTYNVDDPFIGRLSAICLFSGVPIWVFGFLRESDIARFVGIIFTLFGIALLFMRAKITLKDEGIEYRKALGETKLIPYDEVDWVKVDAECASTGTRGSSGYSLFYKMTIVTQQGNIVIRESGGNICNKSLIDDVYAKDRLLLGSPFCAAESFIREKKGMDPKPAALTSFLREAEAKKSSFGRV